ncbi:Forkhead-associated (FHA) domain [Paracoccaceae bacterium]
MSFVDWLLRRKPKGRQPAAKFREPKSEQIKATKAAIEQASIGEGAPLGRFPKLSDSSSDVLTLTASNAYVAKSDPESSVSIWELEDGPVASQPPPPEPEVDAGPRRRPSRTKTRVLGFEPQAAAVVPLFDEGRMEESGQTVSKANIVVYPTGWLIIKEGPGRGAAFALSQGVSQIGRGSDQTVALDFGDMAISRQQHAAIAYDPQSHQFHVGHGGKSNLVRLNGKPLLSTEALEDGDEIQIGETTLLLKVLCTSVFNWSQSEAGGDGHDMAIA